MQEVFSRFLGGNGLVGAVWARDLRHVHESSDDLNDGAFHCPNLRVGGGGRKPLSVRTDRASSSCCFPAFFKILKFSSYTLLALIFLIMSSIDLLSCRLIRILLRDSTSLFEKSSLPVISLEKRGCHSAYLKHCAVPRVAGGLAWSGLGLGCSTAARAGDRLRFRPSWLAGS